MKNVSTNHLKEIRSLCKSEKLTILNAEAHKLVFPSYRNILETPEIPKIYNSQSSNLCTRDHSIDKIQPVTHSTENQLNSSFIANRTRLQQKERKTPNSSTEYTSD